MSCGCGNNDPYNRFFKQPVEAALYNFTFPTTITSVCSLFVFDGTYTKTTSLSVNSVVVSGTVIQAYVKGGIDFTDYTIFFITCDANQQVRERTAVFIVRDLTNAAGLGPNWTDPPPLP